MIIVFVCFTSHQKNYRYIIMIKIRERKSKLHVPHVLFTELTFGILFGVDLGSEAFDWSTLHI